MRAQTNITHLTRERQRLAPLPITFPCNPYPEKKSDIHSKDNSPPPPISHCIDMSRRHTARAEAETLARRLVRYGAARDYSSVVERLAYAPNGAQQLQAVADIPAAARERMLPQLLETGTSNPSAFRGIRLQCVADLVRNDAANGLGDDALALLADYEPFVVDRSLPRECLFWMLSPENEHRRAFRTYLERLA